MNGVTLRRVGTERPQMASTIIFYNIWCPTLTVIS